jgi:thioesterase domain-containing protein
MRLGEIEQKLISFWKELLLIKNVSLYDNFFELGGNQLLFLALKKKIEKYFSIPCKHLSEKQFSNISQQIAFIRTKKDDPSTNMIVNLKPGSNEEFLVFIHPIGGTLFTYKPLIACLQTNKTILGIQDRILSGDFRLYDSIEAQAENYVTALKKTCGAKPIILIGHSSGGIIAFEATKQMLKFGFNIKHLVITDSWAKVPFNINFKEQFIQAIYRQTNKIKPEYFFHSKDEINLWLDVLWHRMTQLMYYQPSKIKIDATLLSASEVIAEYQDANSTPDHGWRKYVRSLQVYKIPGNHETILEHNNALHAAKIINKLLA